MLQILGKKMAAYNHILIASSLAEDNKRVSDKAQHLAKVSNAQTLSIVHVVEFNPMMYGGGEFAIPLDGDLEQSIHDHAEKALKTEAKRLNIPSDRQFIQSGVTAEKLASLVQTINADLLVMGHHERNFFMSMFASTSNSLVHLMPCDVMTVHLK